MIIVLGRPSIENGPIGPRPAGMAATVAMAIAAAGGRVELVGTLGDDAPGDAVAIALARAGVGHAALLRIPGTSTPRGGTADRPARLDMADVELGLGYLTDYRVLVVGDAVPPDVLAVAAEAAAYAGAALVVVIAHGDSPLAGIGSAATVLEAPDDAQGPFAVAVAGYALALEAGTDPALALRGAVEAAGWEPVA
ncbi:MAG TPA: PfkB family carbohydrate kinase [Candidatus Saccharimonadia bacterium]|nr:PfkB family carbohydrate kinase [Candidatus Saccharimonadia bacterium]